MHKRGNWGEFTFSDHTFWMIKLKHPSDGWDQHRMRLWIGFWRFFLSLNLWKAKPWDEPCKDSPEYGISYHNDVIWIAYGPDSYTINMPWQWQIVRHSLLHRNGSIYTETAWNYRGKLVGENVSWYDVEEGWRQEGIHSVMSYQCFKQIELDHYTKTGIYQKANITLRGEEREWRWRWFTWLPFPRMIQRVVDCESDVELGERAGSWKGGMMGWSIPWEKDESPQAAFWRWYKKWDGN